MAFSTNSFAGVLAYFNHVIHSRQKNRRTEESGDGGGGRGLLGGGEGLLMEAILQKNHPGPALTVASKFPVGQVALATWLMAEENIRGISLNSKRIKSWSQCLLGQS